MVVGSETKMETDKVLMSKAPKLPIKDVQSL